MKIISIILAYCLQVTSTYKFIIYSPVFAHSHSIFFAKIADSLTNAGHNVVEFLLARLLNLQTVLSPVMDPLLMDKNHFIDTKEIISLEADKRVVEIYDSVRPYVFDLQDNPLMMIRFIKKFTLSFKYTCETLLKQTDLLEELKHKKFDVGIAESLHFCGFGLFEQLGISATIAASSFSAHPSTILVGEPTAPSYVPSMLQASGEKMSFFARFASAALQMTVYLMPDMIYDGEHEEFIKKYGKSATSPAELISRVSYFFVNSNPYINYPRPTIHKVIDIGGISVDIQRIEKLDEKWDAILNERKLSVFISFGTTSKAADMPEEWKKSIVKLAQLLPEVTFIWKYEQESTLSDEVPNLYMAPWLPQKALLADKRLSLFVTHAGIGSCYELAYLGKASLMIPLIGDQIRNAAMLSRHGGSHVISRSDLANPKTLMENILNILNNSSFAENAAKLSKLLKEQPSLPKNLVVSHAEFVAKFGALPQLDPYGRKLSMFQYFLGDVLLFAVFLLTLLFCLLYNCLKCCFRKLKSRLCKEKEE